MKIRDLLSKENILLGQRIESKKEAIDVLVELQDKAGNLTDKEEYIKDIIERENSQSTAIGKWIAIPHAKSNGVSKSGIVAITVPEGVDYESLDGDWSKVLFMIAVPSESVSQHLEILSRLSVILMDSSTIDKLLGTNDSSEFLNILNEKEDEILEGQIGCSNKKDEKTSVDCIEILAVTACPTGIAHTFMAAKALEEAAKEMGVSIKVETNGQEGVKNGLTEKEIKHAKGIIIAADKNVEMTRFVGKQVLKVKVSDGIRKPKELISRVMEGNAPRYEKELAKDTEVTEKGVSPDKQNNKVSRLFYTHLMNGVSHMLPFVIGGGILIALAFLLDDYEIDPANFGKNTPLAAWFKTMGEYAFNFMLPILSAYIAMSIADRPGLLVGAVGGYIAMQGATFEMPQGNVSSGFLGAMLAGFIGGYIVIGMTRLCSRLPKPLEGLKPVLIYPVAGVVGISIVVCAINPVMAMINTMVSEGLNSMEGSSKILLGCLLGGMMAVDMGGPVNKCAYVFGTASIANGGYDMMASVMAGGMIPPLVIALSTTLFKNKFTEEERKSGIANYVMGLCFISEGAIPYAASDPLRVIPSCVVGAATAGGMSMIFKCTLRAPHGGLFVLPVIGNPLGYVVALISGMFLGALMLGMLKNKKTIADNN